MSCNCNETTKQGKQYCQDCMPDAFHWLVPVPKEPDPFLMDRNHAYIDPNNIIYVLSRDRVKAIKITTSEGNIDLSPYALKEELASKISELTTKLTEGLEGAKYFEGEGIRIDEDNRIHSTVNLAEVNQRLANLEQVDTSPYKAGTGIEITPDLTIKSTVDVSGLDSRVQDLEEQEDKDTKYTAGAGLQLNGTEFSVNPNDLPGTDQLVDINTRVTALENEGFKIDTEGILEYELGGGSPDIIHLSSLNAFIKNVDTTKFNMSIITDTHWDDTDETSYPAGNISVSHYNNFLALNKVSDVQIVNGDNYDSRHLDLEASKVSYRALVSKLYDRELDSDIFINLGNHDDGSDRFPASYKYKNSEFFTEDQLKAIIRAKDLKFGENRENGDSLYWFKDYDEHKIRVIGLWSQDMPEGLTDSNGYAKYKRIHTHAFRQEQLNWLANVALKNLQTDYQVIITTHVPLYYGWQVPTNAPINHDIVGGILHAFMAGATFTGNSTKADFEASVSADFSTQGPRKLVGWFSGHNHFAARYNWGGINIVILDYSVGNSKSAIGTDGQDAISMVEVDTKTNTVNIKGWGRATSSSYKY